MRALFIYILMYADLFTRGRSGPRREGAWCPRSFVIVGIGPITQTRRIAHSCEIALQPIKLFS